MGYRTNVLNDFSTVAKATFHIYEIAKTPLQGDVYQYVDGVNSILPVQINPDNINITYGGKRLTLRGGGIGKPIKDDYDTPHLSFDENSLGGMLHLHIIYDIYDEYNATTLNGLLGHASSCSLSDEDLTSLKKLTECASDSERYVNFIWGDFDFFGHIQTVSCNYTKFSSWGQPLRAEADIELAKTRKELPISGISKTMQRAHETLEKATVLLPLGVSQAMR